MEMIMRATKSWMAVVLGVTMAAPAIQIQAQTAPRANGTVKSVCGNSVVVAGTGQDYTVTVPDAAKILLVDPKTMDTKTATPGTVSDITVGDKAIITGSASDSGTTLTATRVYLLKAAAINQAHAADAAAWAQGGGGIVKSVDAGSGTLVVSSGMKTVTVSTTPKTVIRHYSGGSVSFADAVVCKLDDVKVGDQIRMRGTKSADGASLTADELVAGTFHNFSGLLTAVDASAGTVTLKDLTTKKVVTVAVISGSDVRRVPPMVAQGIARNMKGTAANAAASTRQGQGGGAPAGGPPAGGDGGGNGGQRPGGGGAGRAGADLSQMLSRMPTETIAGLKTGDAVMIVASSSPSDPNKSTAVTLLVGVDAILTAAPSGEGMNLSPWSMGAPGGEGGGGPM